MTAFCFRFALYLCALSVAVFAQTPPASSAPAAPAKPADLKVPAGFTANVFASDVTSGRLMAVAPDGILLVARQNKGDVVALPDKDKDGKADSVDVLVAGLTRPHHMTFRKGYLYIATNPSVVRVKYANGKVEGTPEKFIDLPAATPTTAHKTRTIGFDKRGKFYVSIGSSCNICEEPDPRHTTIMVFNEDGTGGRTYAKGLRNAIGFDFDAKGALWANDMGQDGLGDDNPPDEINRVEDGKHYGFPYYFGNNQPNTGLTDAKGSLKASEATPPAFEIPPHSSPIDMRFYTGKAFPAPYRGALLLVLHGSGGNYKKERIPGRVARVVFQNGKPVALEDFVTGFVQNGQVLGRPAGIVTGANGELFVSDDNKGFVYRVTYKK
ncbi:MAG: sorbosone dehydrogenase family protein [Acidobacteria bacterium]|nr:sorbosone dehydrogenase family protein [Acidobacteriota bacterium]